MKSDQGFIKYLAVAEKIKSGEFKLTYEQLGNWKQLVIKHANTLIQWDKLRKQSTAFECLIRESEEAIEELTRTRDATGSSIVCVVDKVLGQTTGQTMQCTSGIKTFLGMRGSQIKSLLQLVDGKKSKIFFGRRRRDTVELQVTALHEHRTRKNRPRRPRPSDKWNLRFNDPGAG